MPIIDSKIKTHKGFMNKLRSVYSKYSNAPEYIEEINKVIQMIGKNQIRKGKYNAHYLSGKLDGWIGCHPLYELDDSEDLVIVFRYHHKFLQFYSIGTHEEVYNN